MKRKVLFSLCIFAVYASLISCTSTAVFNSLDTNQAGKQQILKGYLTKPAGDGPFPAVVLLHGCAGPKERDWGWVAKLKRWGFVTLSVNSFGPRGVKNICKPGQFRIVSPHRRAKDAYGAKIYLEGLPFVDPNRIAVMGWSHGGETTLHAAQINVPSSSPFQAAVALYPYCIRLYILNSPLLVLIGGKDDWTPANKCKFNIKPKEGWPEIILKVYPDAYHAFDAPFSLNTYLGHKVGRNSSAAVDSYKIVRTFLEKYLIDK